jgi:hypothetical protein
VACAPSPPARVWCPRCVRSTDRHVLHLPPRPNPCSPDGRHGEATRRPCGAPRTAVASAVGDRLPVCSPGWWRCVSRRAGPGRSSHIDDTTIEADVSVGSSVTRRRIVDEILGEAEAVDSAEALAVADRRGDESPDRWVDCGDRRVRLRKALRRLGADPEGGWARILRLSGSRADPDLRVAADRPGSLRARAALGESLV